MNIFKLQSTPIKLKRLGIGIILPPFTSRGWLFMDADLYQALTCSFGFLPRSFIMPRESSIPPFICI